MKKDKILKITALCLLVALLVVVFSMVNAEPDGATVTYVSNTTKNASSPDSRQDNKGTITTILINTVQQNNKWKAYVGNVSGTLVLRDADDYSIYEWPTGGAPDGEVYISRNSTIDWTSIQCANETDVTTEETSLGHSASAADNINKTFAYTIHEQIIIGEVTITNSTCQSFFPYVNDTAQTASESALFQEVLLMDANSRIVYTALIDQDTMSFHDSTQNITYDFQALVPDSTGGSTSTYYFYVEIDG